MPADAVFRNHTGFWDAGHILCFLAFPLPPFWSKSHNVFKPTRQFQSNNWGMRHFSLQGARGWAGVSPSTAQHFSWAPFSVLLLLFFFFFNTDLYLPAERELSGLTSVMLTQARIKNNLFTLLLRLYRSMFLCWETGCCFISPYIQSLNSSEAHRELVIIFPDLLSDNGGFKGPALSLNTNIMRLRWFLA